MLIVLGSGLFPMQQIKNPKRPIRVGLGSDIGAGTRFSLLERWEMLIKSVH